MPVKNKVTVSLVIDPQLLEALDALRGKTPRSAVICEAVRDWVAAQEKS
jgi:metal-responsive CopG/Arc/MetJ family transcriptional regulator